MHLREFLARALEPPGVLGRLRALPLVGSRQRPLRLPELGLQTLAFGLGLGRGVVGVPPGVVQLSREVVELGAQILLASKRLHRGSLRQRRPFPLRGGSLSLGGERHDALLRHPQVLHRSLLLAFGVAGAALGGFKLRVAEEKIFPHPLQLPVRDPQLILRGRGAACRRVELLFGRRLSPGDLSRRLTFRGRDLCRGGVGSLRRSSGSLRLSLGNLGLGLELAPKLLNLRGVFLPIAFQSRVELLSGLVEVCACRRGGFVCRFEHVVDGLQLDGFLPQRLLRVLHLSLRSGSPGLGVLHLNFCGCDPHLGVSDLGFGVFKVGTLRILSPRL